jgi:cytochrome c oxidase subunit 3
MIVFLASDLMLFAAFFATYYLLRSVNDVWPTPTANLDVVRAGAATAALLASSATCIAADRSLEAGRLERYRRWLLATIALGAAFLTNQLLEYRSLDFRPSTDAYGSIYWLLTGLHSVHVLSGVVALGLLVIRSTRARSPERLGSWNTAISAFWHLVDVVWVGVFTTIWIVR